MPELEYLAPGFVPRDASGAGQAEGARGFSPTGQRGPRKATSQKPASTRYIVLSWDVPGSGQRPSIAQRRLGQLWKRAQSGWVSKMPSMT